MAAEHFGTELLILNLNKWNVVVLDPIDYDRERWAARVAYGGHWRSGDLSQWYDGMIAPLFPTAKQLKTPHGRCV